MEHDATGDADVDPAGFVPRTKLRARQLTDSANTRFDQIRERSPLIDIGTSVFERDKQAAGTLLGSALALRLFLFFVPLALFAVGVAGILGGHLGVSSPSDTAGLSGSVAQQINSAFDQSGTTPWLAAGLGLIGVASTGRSLTRALVLSSALSWQLGGKQKTPVRAIGVVVGLVVGVTLAAAILNRIREASGVAVASVSFLGAAAIYVVLWSLLFQALPRATTDPGAALPGASIVGVGLAGLQAVSQLYLPRQIENASSVYGALGITIAFLGWFFFLGRAIAFSFSLNAVIYERIGSVSGVVFAVPVIRELPRRVPAVARYFALESEPSTASASSDPGDISRGGSRGLEQRLREADESDRGARRSAAHTEADE
jgi:uncharacterized BrkB/YihY/UPF0761 family membrane protein